MRGGRPVRAARPHAPSSRRRTPARAAARWRRRRRLEGAPYFMPAGRRPHVRGPTRRPPVGARRPPVGAPARRPQNTRVFCRRRAPAAGAMLPVLCGPSAAAVLSIGLRAQRAAAGPRPHAAPCRVRLGGGGRPVRAPAARRIHVYSGRAGRRPLPGPRRPHVRGPTRRPSCRSA